MPEAAVKTRATQKVIAPPRQRHFRAAIFQSYILMASMMFVGLAVAAHFVPYFSIDLTVTRAVQSNHGALVDQLMRDISWIGFAPQAFILAFVAVVALYFAGLRWEAVSAIFAAGNVGLGTVIKVIVLRPRPGADLVHVVSKLNTSGFPSGHVLSTTALAGYLAFLAFTLLKPSWGRTVITSFLGLLIILMGLSRIYLGHHWFSDVMGAYLLGSLWLALTIKFYRWGKERFFRRQPAAPEAPVASPEPATPGAGR